MRILADSQVLVWWLDDPRRLSKRALEELRNPANEVYFSAASIWELGLKIAKGKLIMPSGFVKLLLADHFQELCVTSQDAEASLLLPPLHGDPFDRLLIGQALTRGLVLATRDGIIPSYPVPVLPA